jgi:hypothetical protein
MASIQNSIIEETEDDSKLLMKKKNVKFNLSNPGWLMIFEG